MTPPSVPFLRTKKFWSAVIGTVLALLPVIFADPDLSRTEKMAMWQNFTIVVGALWGGIIIAQGAADYAERRDAPSGTQQPPAPSVQVNTNSESPSLNVVPPAPPSLVNPGIHNPPIGHTGVSTVPLDKPKGS